MMKAMQYLAGFTPKFWLAIVGALLLALPLSYCKGRGDGVKLTRAEYAEAAREAVEQARQADAVAGDVVQSGKQEVEAKNDEARNAAAGSDDPLADGLSRLR